MLEIEQRADGTMALAGRLDAAQAPKMLAALDGLSAAARLDCARLEYISSAGLGVLLKTQKRLGAAGGLTLVNVNAHILDVFRYSGFDQIFRIEGSGA
jgi:anti-sigma B factor antagonist